MTWLGEKTDNRSHMKRVLAVIEDYNERAFVETLLKKVGFDCVGINKDAIAQDQMISFAPEVVIANYSTKKVNGLLLSKKIQRSNKNLPKFVLVLPEGQTADKAGRAAEAKEYHIDFFVESPIQPRKILGILAQAFSLDEAALVGKFEKLGGIEIDTDKAHVIKSSAEKQKRYEQALKNLPPPKQNGMTKALVADQVKEFRLRAKDPELIEIDKERQAFVKALFKK